MATFEFFHYSMKPCWCVSSSAAILEIHKYKSGKALEGSNKTIEKRKFSVGVVSPLKTKVLQEIMIYNIRKHTSKFFAFCSLQELSNIFRTATNQKTSHTVSVP